MVQNGGEVGYFCCADRFVQRGKEFSSQIVVWDGDTVDVAEEAERFRDDVDLLAD